MSSSSSSFTFTPTSLSTWIHQHLPHYTAALAHIPPDEITPNYVVDDHTDTYATSLGILAFLLFCWFPIYILIELFIRFIYCCCCRKPPHHSPHIEGSSRHLQHHSKHVNIRWHIAAAIAALVCAAGIATSYQQHIETTKGMKTVISSLDNISDYQHSLLTDLARIRVTLNDSSVILDTLIHPDRANDTLPPGILDKLTIVQTEIDNIHDECQQVEDQGSSFILNETLHVMRDEEKTRDSSVISLLTLVLVLLFLLMAFYWCCLRLSSTCRGVMQIITVFILGITLIYACVLIGLSLGASDICQQPDTYADYIISSRTSGEATLILEYYLYCDSRANPITPRIEKAIKSAGALSLALIGLNNTLASQDPAIYADIRPSIDELFIDASVVDSTLIQTSMRLDCKYAHEEYQHAVDGACQRVLDGAFIMGVVLGLSVIFFLLFRLCLRVRVRPPPTLEDSFSFSYQPLSAQPSPSMRAQTTTKASFYTYTTPPNQTNFVHDPLNTHNTSIEDSREGQPSTEGYYFYPQERR